MNKKIWVFDFHPNVGKIDKGVRYALGATLIGAVLFTAPLNVGWLAILPLIAIPIVISAITGWDPVYSVFQKRPTFGV